MHTYCTYTYIYTRTLGHTKLPMPLVWIIPSTHSYTCLCIHITDRSELYTSLFSRYIHIFEYVHTSSRTPGLLYLLHCLDLHYLHIHDHDLHYLDLVSLTYDATQTLNVHTSHCTRLWMPVVSLHICPFISYVDTTHKLICTPQIALGFQRP